MSIVTETSGWRFVQRALLLCVLLLCMAIVPQYANGAGEIDAQISFYGTLRDTISGDEITGDVDMIFNIYATPDGFDTLWTGTYTRDNGNPVSVVDGEFSVMLGSGDGNEILLDFTGFAYYIGVTIEDDSEMTPRDRLSASPYAFNADRLDGFHATSFLQNGSLININKSTSTSLLTLTQTGGGNFLIGFDDAEEVFSINNTGVIAARSFENLFDEYNVFAGPLHIQSGDASFFDADVQFSNGAGVGFGSENGLYMYQDTDVFSNTTLIIAPQGDAIFDGSVNIAAPGTLTFTSNSFNACTDGCEPTLELIDDGSAQIYNTSYGDEADRFFEINFTSGVRIPNGGLRIGEGAPAEALDVDGTILATGVVVDGVISASSLSGLGVQDLSSDDNGNIIAVPSDERFKENIRTIDNALDLLLNLRGVRYEWRDVDRFGEQTEVGFIAQELQPVLPEVVREAGDYLSINTKNITAVIVEAIKELHEQVTEYFTRTEQLEREVAELRKEIEILRQAQGLTARENVLDNAEDPDTPRNEEVPTDPLREGVIDEPVDEGVVDDQVVETDADFFDEISPESEVVEEPESEMMTEIPVMIENVE